MGFSPFGIDGSRAPDTDLTAGYDLIAQLAPLISAHQGKGHDIRRLARAEQPVSEDSGGELYGGGRGHEAPNYGWGAPTTGDSASAAAIFIAVGPDEYYVAGSGMTIRFSPNGPGPAAGRARPVEEGSS